MRTLDHDALGRVDHLLRGEQLRRPRPERDRWGRWHRDRSAEYDWFYALPADERGWIQREVMAPAGRGIEPDVLATMAGYDAVDDWANALVAAIREARRRDEFGRDVFDVDEPEPEPDDDELVGPAEVADLLQVTRNAIAQWRHRGLLPAPAFELSGLPVWYRGDVVTWAIRTGRDVIDASDAA